MGRELSDEIIAVVFELQPLASALRMTGNPQLAARLLSIQKEVTELAEQIRQLDHQRTIDDFRKTMQASQNLIRGVLTGMSIGEEKQS